MNTLHRSLRLPCSVIVLILFGNLNVLNAANFTSIRAGNWSDPCTWHASCTGAIPGTSDNITVAHAVVMNQNVSVNTGTLTVNSGASLIEDATRRTLTLGQGTGSAPTATATFNGTVTIGVINAQKMNMSIGSLSVVTATCSLTTINNTNVTIAGKLVVKGGWTLNNGNISASGAGVLDVYGCADGTNGAFNGVSVLFCVRGATGGGNGQPVTSGCNVSCNNVPGAANTSNCANSVFPVELNLFTAEHDPQTQVTRLHWVTLHERNNQGFVLERSDDAGKSYYVIGFVNGAGNSDELENYHYDFYDQSPGQAYYRLRQTDLDGTVSYLGIAELTVNHGLQPAELFSVYPNPASDEVKVRLTGDIHGQASIRLVSLQGTVLASFTQHDLDAMGTLRVDTSTLPSGTYALTVSDEAGRLEREMVTIVK